MAAKRDGVADGWILYEGWCKRNGGIPIRGSSSAEHICFKGPLPEDTIDPGDSGTVDIAVPGGGRASQFDLARAEFALREAELRADREAFNRDVVRLAVDAARKADHR